MVRTVSKEGGVPGPIEFLAGLGVVLAVLTILGEFAQRWGVDSRGFESPTQEPWFGGH